MKNIYHVNHIEDFIKLNFDTSEYILSVSATIALYNIKPNNHGLNVIAINKLFRQVANDPRFEQVVAKDSGDMAFRLGHTEIYVYGRIYPHVINNDELIAYGEIHNNINFIPLDVIRDKGLGMEKEIQGYINKVRMYEAKEKYERKLFNLNN